FDALKPPPPPIDPAEVARLQEAIARQQQIIAQFEQMQATFGAATPAAVTQGLAEARDALARVQADLAALGAGTTAPPSAPEALAPASAPEALAPASALATETQLAPPEAPAAP